MYLPIDRTKHAPLYLQIEESVRKLVANGTLRPGERLPSMRELARSIGVNRITVEAAFSRLESSGLVYSHVGRGTFVAQSAADAPPRPPGPAAGPEAVARLWGPLFVDLRPSTIPMPSLGTKAGSEAISFVPAAPPAELFPAHDFQRCVAYVLKRRIDEIARLGPSDGLPALKTTLMRWLSHRSIEASEEEILITTGCQQAMDLVRKVLLGPGDALLMENPTYPGAVTALASSSVERYELPLQDGTIDMRAFQSLNGRSRAKLIYVVPNFQNPTGACMSLEERQQLVAHASHQRVPILEDDVFGELSFGGTTLPSLKALAPHLVIYIGSFSKMISPGLRVGWVVAPRPVIKQLRLLKQAADLQTNLLVQAALDEFCRRELLHRHLKRVRRVFVRRRDAMAEALQKHFPEEAQWQVPTGGLSFWVTLNASFDSDEFLKIAQDKGVEFVPGSAFYFRSPMCNSLRLSFAAETEERIQHGIRILGGLLRSERRSRSAVAATSEPARPPIM
jgi:GntR family transcriptional regulator/MocR family aminotransferase